MAAVPFPLNPALTALTISYSNAAVGYIADQVMPRVPVGASRFSWTEHPIAERFTVPNTLVGRRGRVERVEFSGVERTGETHDYALEDGIPQTDIDDAASMRARGLGTFDPMMTAAEGLTNLIMTDREMRVAAKVQDPNNYGSSRRLVLSGSDQFSAYMQSNPIDVLKEGFNSTLIFRPNTAVMSREVWSIVSSHPQIVNAVRGQTTTRGIVSQEEFVRLFSGEGLKNLLIGEGFVNMARRGQLANIQRVWGKSIALLYIDPTMRPEGGATWGMTAQYGTRVAFSWDDRNIGIKGGTIVRVGEQVSEFVCAPDVGYLIQNAVE
ncbi:capsid protein [Methylobacterium sp. NMS12]|uniref:capsid protein n=1 Tax=Methylobacterium sp. NMS12 TaxID=3079766 RepID=UPI003F882B5B